MYSHENFDEMMSASSAYSNFEPIFNAPPMRPPSPPPFGGGPGRNPGMNPGPFPGTPNSGQMPLSPPPQRVPNRSSNLRAVDPGSIRNCVGRFTYVWLDNGIEFWMFPIQLGRRSVSGFRWNPHFGWVYFGVSLDRIDSFTCV